MTECAVLSAADNCIALISFRTFRNDEFSLKLLVPALKSLHGSGVPGAYTKTAAEITPENVHQYAADSELEVTHGIARKFALPETLELNAFADDGRLETLAIDYRKSSLKFASRY